MNEDLKSVREHAARARAYAGKADFLRALAQLADGIEMLARSQIFGRDKTQLEILFDETLKAVGASPQLSNLFPGGLCYTRGKEAAMVARLRAIHARICAAIEKAEENKVRKRKLAIDQAILAAQKLMENGEPLEARKIFRRLSEQFEDESGIFQDIGGRLLKAGFLPECVEYLEKAVEKDPRDPRPYTYLMAALEGLGELEKAEELAKNVLRTFGANERTYTRLARIALARRNWDAAYDAARAALSFNPNAREAKSIAEQVSRRIF